MGTVNRLESRSYSHNGDWMSRRFNDKFMIEKQILNIY